MTPAVVEIGPQTVRGPDTAPQEWISVAIECIDDTIAVLDGRLVEVARLWRDVVGAAAGDHHTGTLVLIFPTWWSSARVDLVTAAARDAVTEVIVLQRSSILGADTDATVIELSDEFVVTAPPGSEVTVSPRDRYDVAACLAAAESVLVDVPAGVTPLGPALTAQLRFAGIPFTHCDRDVLLCAVSAAAPARGSARPRPGRRTVAVLAGAVLSVAAVAGGWAAQTLSGDTPADTSTALVVEGRVAVPVPAHWTVERVTSGPGSARLRVSAPATEQTALHITQAAAATPVTIADAAESLRRALESEAPGVFVDFDPAGSVGTRPAVTYRELRAGSETTWAVVVDAEFRIAVGCQSPPADRGAIGDACVRAVQSAHVVR